MKYRWRISTKQEPIGYVSAFLSLDNESVIAFRYNPIGDPKEKAQICTRGFCERLADRNYIMNEDELQEMYGMLFPIFENFKYFYTKGKGDNLIFENSNHSTTKYNSNNPMFEREVALSKLGQHECYFSKYIVDTCIEAVSKGITNLVPGTNRIPKSINFITSSHKKYYAKISKIEVLTYVNEKSLNDVFPNSFNNAIIAFQVPNTRLAIAFSLGYIGESNDDRTVQFYKPNQGVKFNVGETAVFYNLSDCEAIYYTDSPLLPTLNPALNYYNQRLEEINHKAESIKVSIDLDLLRVYFDEFRSMAVDESMIIVPVIGKAVKINGISVSIKNYDNKIIKYDFYDANLNTIAKDDKESYLETLQEVGIKLPGNADLAILNLVNLSDKDIFLLRAILTDSRSYSCIITNNIEGDRVRLNRIIKGIENSLTDSVANKKLVELVCNNDINVSANCNTISSYVVDTDYIESLKSEYPILKNNVEQLIAIDKIMQMDKKHVDVMLVQGPPGTGKTELILALAKELSKKKYNTLITSNVHVACDNIVDRLKNNKNIVLKRYTSIHGEKYEKEIIENKKKYVENQVLEGFKFKDSIIDSFDSYDKIKESIKNEKERKQQILDSKARYDNDLHEYNELILQRERLKEELSENNSDLDITLKNIDELKEAIETSQNTISKNTEKINYKNSVLESLHTNATSQNNTILKINEQLNTLNSKLCTLKKEIETIAHATQTTEESIKSLDYQIAVLSNYSDFLSSVTEDSVKAEVIPYVIEGKTNLDKKYEFLLQDSLIRANIVMDIYNNLKNDMDFWNTGSNISYRFIEYIVFKSKNDDSIVDILGENCLNKIHQVYEYLKAPDSKRSIMSFFPFIKLNGFNKSYYEKCLSEITLDFKNIQYNYIEIISTYICNDASPDIIQKKLELNNQKMNDTKKALQTSTEECTNNKNHAIALREEQLKLEKEIEIVTHDLNSIKASYEDSIKQIKELNDSILETTRENDSLSISCSKYNTDLEKEISLVSTFKDKQNQLTSLIESVQLEIQKIFTLKQVVIENYNLFISKMNIDLEDLEKKLKVYENTLEIIDSKIQQLISNGWNEQEAKEFIFDYANELQDIVACPSENVEKHFFNGRGNEFNKMFLLSEKSDGSLISMTTNQIASLLASADNRNITFDYAIIDEASKCNFEDLIISLPRIKHLVLIGDFMQLDPMYDAYSNIDLKYQNIFSVNEWDNINKSNFSLLLSQFIEYNKEYGITNFELNPYVSIMKRQYRMNKGIFNLIEPVYSIHKGFDLIDEKQTSANDVKCINVNGNEIAVDTSQCNIEEVDAIVSFLEAFQANRQNFPNIKTIGIITGYRAQENYLRRKLKSIKLKGVQIGTFDRFQGREYDLVIVSLVRTKKLGFTNNVRRMNVAFSRAKSHLLIFGNIEALNKIATKIVINDDEEFSNPNIDENTFVIKSLIPQLYSIRENYVSDDERVNDILDFIKENNYE